MFKCFLFWKFSEDHANYLKIIIYQTNCDGPYVGLTQLHSFRSFEVIWGQMRVLPLTFDRIEIEQYGWFQCISLAEMHRLICNMACLGHDVTSSDFDLRSDFDLDLPRSTCTYFDRSRIEEHDGVRIISLAFLDQKLLAKNHLCHLTFDGLWWPQYWPERIIDWNSFEIIFDEHSNASSRFSLRRLVAELDWGRLDAPPGRSRMFRSNGQARVNDGHQAIGFTVILHVTVI